MSVITLKTFHGLYTEYFRKSFLFVKSYVHDDLVAEDIVSESLIKLWEELKEVETDHFFTPVNHYFKE